MLKFTRKEITLMQKLDTPAKIQDFLNALKFNFEEKGETLKSPIMILRKRNAHCMEGALLGAYILSLHGFLPLILHLQTTKDDFDHVISPFKQYGLWGALSKTNHAVLRYREPVYKNIHELIMSYFHEYFLNKNGKKTLRRYSRPLNLNIFGRSWVVADDDLWQIDKALDKIKHYNIIPKIVSKNLRKAEKIEIKAGEIVQFKKY
ncbi:MAG: hypothetical protein UR62_C0007G0009 [Candidatus Nomurabacteria bacterium GW2011_GWF2_35_12]|uniref:Transglutaminase-like domain-containing protein n=1 Tax=Candidatus Nomurabacteria bacterium GW2011_GWA1_36_15 TaxID=1618728 RepID=A0A0G0DWU0_9BACT|nr:MAG: hypothetical protein UR62_C0007G0009 [Candidatus Nomurabacteria bacterium GW2011_GWF2_35_12]KKP76311.1 MAG: hypothetical protein UR72_C0003G0010 [Parcubacteria group bacterium GW2011_GWC1_35_21]KKP77502.1 MAG: hypothetical protein UR77_C0023G0007 [Candidatus Nomurabacteria bacterium GW2011_GWC2_35_35]KKP97648.1 MAG: hypothetical protein US05_C0013G0005 [Candidatus Nomurabacteria bacterium GW2011_GWA1_36_15]HCY17607.1 hypothetical protein [Candidatus Nomurabacteria bacterium]